VYKLENISIQLITVITKDSRTTPLVTLPLGVCSDSRVENYKQLYICLPKCHVCLVDYIEALIKQVTACNSFLFIKSKTCLTRLKHLLLVSENELHKINT